MIDFNCPGCGHYMSMDEKFAGQTGKCPKCRHHMAVPNVQSTLDDLQIQVPSKELESTSVQVTPTPVPVQSSNSEPIATKSWNFDKYLLPIVVILLIGLAIVLIADPMARKSMVPSFTTEFWVWVAVIGFVALVVFGFVSSQKCPSCAKNFAKEVISTRSTERHLEVRTESDGQQRGVNVWREFYTNRCTGCGHTWETWQDCESKN